MQYFNYLHRYMAFSAVLLIQHLKNSMSDLTRDIFIHFRGDKNIFQYLYTDGSPELHKTIDCVQF